MEKAFEPNFQISGQIARCLMRIEAAKERVQLLPLTPMVMSSLRETARLVTAHYSTMIEGNRLSANEVRKVIQLKGHFPGRERDEKEVRGYYVALEELEKWAATRKPLTETLIQTIHALVYGGGRSIVTPTSYRLEQNVIRDGSSGKIVYMPPEAKDVPALMSALASFLLSSHDLPCPIVAGLAHYQFATIHPYMDGNGRTARLLTTYLLHTGGYDLKGLYSLEEYYANNLSRYYDAISLGPSHNYYMGREKTDITPWLEYFCGGMADSFDKVSQQMGAAQALGKKDQSKLLRKLDPKQRKALELFQDFEIITAQQLGELFGFKRRSVNNLCRKWVEAGFLEIEDESRKARRYRLARRYLEIIE